jgi:hypothetical protein
MFYPLDFCAYLALVSTTLQDTHQMWRWPKPFVVSLASTVLKSSRAEGMIVFGEGGILAELCP